MKIMRGLKLMLAVSVLLAATRLMALDTNAVINGWLGIPSSVAAENMAQAQWDSLTVDLQHGLVDYQTAVSMMQAIATTPTIPLARVPWMEPGIIMKLLDAGAYKTMLEGLHA